MPDKPIIFKSLSNIEEIEQIAEQLAQHNIAYEIESPPQLLDKNFIGELAMPDHYLKIKAADFSKANNIVDELYKNIAATIDKEYFLFDFTEEQLLQVVNNKNDWGDLNYHIALELIRRMGITYNHQLTNELEAEAAAIAPKTVNPIYLFITYALLLMSFILPIPYLSIGALIIGLFLYGATKTLRTGIKVNYYDDGSRKNGIAIIVIACLSIIWLLYKIFSLASDN